MLLSLYIENVAIIKQSDIDFSFGFNVLTGETGAGKSIIIDSINLLLGNKGSRDLVSSNSDYSLVSAVFTGFNDEQISAFAQKDIQPDQDGNIVISRKITKDGRSVSKINGVAVTVSLLKEIAPLFVSIHGQHDGSKILDSSYHIEYLDECCDIDRFLKQYRENYDNVKSIRQKIEHLTQLKLRKNEIEESLKYKISEIEKADIKIGEREQLVASKSIAKNSALISTSLYNADQLLNGDNVGLIENVNLLMSELTPLIDILEGTDKNVELLNAVKAQLEEVSHSVSNMFSEHEVSELSEEYIEERLYIIDKLLSKYSSEAEALSSLESFRKELDVLEDNEFELQNAYDEYSASLITLEKLAQNLSDIRTDAAKKISEEINNQLKELDMPHVRFEVRITRNTNSRGGNKYSYNGFDCVEFYISPNAGQDLKPLAKIASGGEMSRIMLCLKTVLNKNKSENATIIYDEIDSGVSGGTAQKIGYKLKKSSADNQVFCVTHLAQIAAMADNHFKVSKGIVDGVTCSEIKLLGDDERRYEIARIMGGTDITEQLLKTADELIKSSVQ